MDTQVVQAPSAQPVSVPARAWYNRGDVQAAILVAIVLVVIWMMSGSHESFADAARDAGARAVAMAMLRKNPGTTFTEMKAQVPSLDAASYADFRSMARV